MLKDEKIADTLRSILPTGDVTLEDDDSIDFQFQIGTANLKAWAFIFGEYGLVIQIYCIDSSDAQHLNATRHLLSELNFRMPFGSYQISGIGRVTYRTQCFAENTEQADFSIRRALEWAETSIEEHLAGIAAVSGGFTTPEAAIQLIDSKSSMEHTEDKSDVTGAA